MGDTDARIDFAKRIMRALPDKAYVEVTYLKHSDHDKLVEARDSLAGRPSVDAKGDSTGLCDHGGPTLDDVYQTLRTDYSRSKFRGQHPLHVYRYGKRGASGKWLAVCLLTTLQEVEGGLGVVGLFNRFRVRQVNHAGDPPKRFLDVQSKALKLGRVPVLVHARRGSKQGVCVVPLGWWVRDAPYRENGLTAVPLKGVES